MSNPDDSGSMELDRRRFMQATGVGVAGLTAGNIVQGRYEASWDDPDEVLDVLYIGGVEDGALHYSEDLLKVITPYLLKRGIKTHYTERQDDLNYETLSNYDAVMLYGNRLEPTEEQIDALESFVEDGGGFVPVHSASASFGAMDEDPDGLAERFTNLVGGGFDWHGHEDMTTDRIEPDHPVFEGAEPIEAFEETYRHHNLNDDIEVLAHGAGGDYEDGEDEPFTWVRTQGDGRVFYTAWGHDDGVWEETGFQQLIENGIRWSSGNEDSIGNHPELDDLSYSHVEDEYGHSEVPYYQGDAPNEVSSGDDGVWDLVQDPLPVSDSMAHTVTPAEFEMEYFVSEDQYSDYAEGQIMDMAFDAAGRCWLSVSQDYPNNAGEQNDAILICEDTDGDGIADDFTVFKDDLSVPLSLIPYEDGVLVSEVQSFDTDGRVVYFGDEDGDDVADVEETIFTGFGTGDTHAGLNQLHYGVDNWVYGVVGYEGLDPDIDEDVSLFQDLFRFKPDGSEIELVGSGASNMAGVKTNEEGLVFCSSATAGSDVTTYAAIPDSYYEYINGYSGFTTVDIRGENLSRTEDENRILPVNDRYRQVDQQDGFTAVTDQEFYTAREFPEQYWNKTAFVGEGTGQLLATFHVEQEGAGYSAVNHQNLVASNDEWVSPTYVNTGPDGMVWMIDFYNFVFQHNPTPSGYENGAGNAYETNKRDDEHSRLYRVTTGDDVDLHPQDLSDASPSELVDALTDDNKFWRRTAQRLLIERGETDVVDDLVELVQDQSTDEIGLSPGAIHALWTLEGLDALDETASSGDGTLTHQDPADLDDVDDSVDHVIQWTGSDGSDSSDDEVDVSDVVRDALTHNSAGVRLNALRVLPGDQQLQDDILDNDLLEDEDGRVQMWALLKLAETPESDAVGEAVFDMIDQEENYEDDLLVEAASVAGAAHAAGFISAYESTYDPDDQDDEDQESENLLPNPSFEETETSAGPDGWESEEWAGSADFVYDDEEAYVGENSIRIESESGVDGAWAQTVEVEEDTEYTLSGWIKTEDVDAGSGDGAQFNVHELGQDSLTDSVTGTEDWTQVEITVNSGDNDELQINALLGAWGESTGTAWYDDISFEGPDGENLLSNADFAEGSTSSSPEEWGTDAWGGTVEHTHTDEYSHSGDYSVRLHSEDGADAAWSTSHDVEPNAEYRISGYAKTEDVEADTGYGALLGIGGLDMNAEDARTDAVTGTEDWTEVSWEFETGTVQNINIHAMIGWHGESSGTIWWDDISLVQTSSPTDGIHLVYNRVTEHVDHDEDGGDEPEPPADAIEAGTTIDLDGITGGWEGLEPESIEGETNPTLTLIEGETYELGWSQGDGMPHNVAIWDADGDVVDDLQTPVVQEPDEDQFIEFEASSEMAEYVCEAHLDSMVGEIDVVEG
ncbi:PVC-type heme-binding CxxCH protein [Natrialbaceae archaeon A-arb3/5]